MRTRNREQALAYMRQFHGPDWKPTRQDERYLAQFPERTEMYDREHHYDAAPHATGDDNPGGDVCRACIEDPDEHRFTLRVVEEYPDGKSRVIGLIEEDDDAQEYVAIAIRLPALGRQGKKGIGGYRTLQEAIDAVQRYWLTEPAPAGERVYLHVAGRQLWIKVLEESHPTSDSYAWTPVDVLDVDSRMEAQAIVKSGLSIPALLAQHQIRSAIASAILNATTTWTKDETSGTWGRNGTGRQLTDAEKRAIHP